MNKVPISESKGLSGCTGIAAVLFGLPFFGLGCFFFNMMWLQPALLWKQAQNWPTTQATVVASQVERHSSSDGSTYSPEITYKYQVNGKDYENDQYALSDYSTSGNWAQDVVNEHPVDSKATIWFNPSEPSKSLLNRKMGWLWLLGLLPLIFVTVGAFFIFYVSRAKPKANKKAKSLSASGLSPHTERVASPFKSGNSKSTYEFEDDNVDLEFDIPLRLKPENSRLAGFIFVCLFGTVWCSLVGFFMYLALKEGFANNWFEILFLIPFVLVGIGCIVGAVYMFLAMFNPKVVIALNNGAVPTGGDVELAWEVTGKADRFRKFTVDVIGEEVATYRRGTSTYTDRNTFITLPVIDTDSVEEMTFGSKTISIPGSTMHSMDAGDNEIKWMVEVHGDVPWWPDVKEKLEFRVKP